MTKMKIRFNSLSLYVLISIVIALPGCASKATNYIPLNLPANSLETIAQDIAPIIAEYTPAKSTRFILHEDDLSRALATNLGKLGYGVMFLEPGAGGQRLENEKGIQYTIDWVTPKSLYIALIVNNRQRYTRTYTIDRGTLVPDKIKIIGTNR